jgi:lysophospholipase L1-like esterase
MSQTGKGPAGRPGPGGRLSKKQLTLIVCLGALAVVLILALVLAAVLPSCAQQPVTSSAGSLPGGSSVAADAGYNKDANSIPAAEYAGTILQETADAGDGYVTETLFLGDSNTGRMLAFRDITGVTLNNGIGIESMGITHVTTLACVKFKGMEAVTVPRAVSIMQPRRVFMNYGTNDTLLPTADFIRIYRAAATAVHEAYPQADIIIGSVFPITKTTTYNTLSQTKIDEFNLALVSLAREMEFKFLNWSEALRDETGYCERQYMLDDGLHLNQKGMELLFDYFRTHSYITDDSRPKPLKDIPVREGTPAGLFPKPAGDASSFSLSSSLPAEISVTFKAGEGGDLKMGVNTQLSFTVSVPPGVTTGQVLAVPRTGYVFKYWTVTQGTIADTSNPALPGFTVPTYAAPGVAITVTAVFEVPPLITVPTITDPTNPPAGWTVNITNVPTAAYPPGTVIPGSQSPAGGSAINPGDPQVISVSVAAPLITVPNLIGSDFNTVAAAPDGWTIAGTPMDVAGTAGEILTQDVPAGSLVGAKGVINVTYVKYP